MGREINNKDGNKKRRNAGRDIALKLNSFSRQIRTHARDLYDVE